MRIVVTLISGVATLYFVFWVGGALVFSLHLPLWIVSLGSLLVAAVVAWCVWSRTASFQASRASSVLLGAFVVGSIGFSAGFFGPLLFTPSAGANVGPVLGIFITGPLGFILGAIGGAVYWYVRLERKPGVCPRRPNDS
ncbi:MAG TPA: hypothetical protein VF173_15165 [Thermoanaerobaculia bacterium]|nr:hypothetical protein [Thermoanaerobaculia bacterium]